MSESEYLSSCDLQNDNSLAPVQQSFMCGQHFICSIRIVSTPPLLQSAILGGHTQMFCLVLHRSESKLAAAWTILASLPALLGRPRARGPLAKPFWQFWMGDSSACLHCRSDIRAGARCSINMPLVSASSAECTKLPPGSFTPNIPTKEFLWGAEVSQNICLSHLQHRHEIMPLQQLGS